MARPVTTSRTNIEAMTSRFRFAWLSAVTLGDPETTDTDGSAAELSGVEREVGALGTGAVVGWAGVAGELGLETAALAMEMVATKRYPRRGTVSMKRGLSASSLSAVRNFFTATFRPLSNSTKVLPGQRACRISSRVTTSPGRPSRRTRI